MSSPNNNKTIKDFKKEFSLGNKDLSEMTTGAGNELTEIAALEYAQALENLICQVIGIDPNDLSNLKLLETKYSIQEDSDGNRVLFHEDEPVLFLCPVEFNNIIDGDVVRWEIVQRYKKI